MWHRRLRKSAQAFLAISMFVACSSGAANPPESSPVSTVEPQEPPTTAAPTRESEPRYGPVDDSNAADGAAKTDSSAGDSSATQVSQTSTTVGSSSATAPKPGSSPEGVLGVVGCSNTASAVEGYLTVSDEDKLAKGGVSGGALGRWGNPDQSSYASVWRVYDAQRPPQGYNGAWVQVCLRFENAEPVMTDNHKTLVSHVVEQIRMRDPGITVWISGLNSFGPDFVCPATGPDGPAVTAAVANWAVDHIDGAQRGPDLGPLGQAQIVEDGTCHPNHEGRLFLGGQLVAFFDG